MVEYWRDLVEKWPPEAEHVGPVEEAAVGVERIEAEAGFDQAPGVVGDAEEDEGLTVADAMVEAADGFSGFGGVLGDVGGDGLFGDVGAVTEGFDGPDAELSAPAEAAGGLIAGGGDGDGRVRVRGSGLDRGREEFGGGPGWGRRVRSVRADETDHDVEVDGAPLLELGHLAVGDERCRSPRSGRSDRPVAGRGTSAVRVSLLHQGTHRARRGARGPSPGPALLATPRSSPAAVRTPDNLG